MGCCVGNGCGYTGDLARKETTSKHRNLRKIAPGVDWAFWDPEDWTMDVRGNEGRVMLKVEETASLEVEVEEEEYTVEEDTVEEDTVEEESDWA
jgi:hypothetical protein